jgi:TolB-like protein/DNA-binding winged helix-turn-helix (wHTH) protein/Flp pilus assembly protein TadD
MTAADRGPTFRFRDCELDVAAYVLRRNGRPIRLERQPMDLLIFLIERRARLVTRAEIADRLWGKDVFVDVETGVHTAVRKIRQALRDSAESPAFLETIPGKGYRFVAPVDLVSASAATLPRPGPDPAVERPEPVGSVVARPHLTRFVAITAEIAVVLVMGLYWWAARARDAMNTPAAVTLAVLPFANLSGDPDRGYVAEGLAEETAVSLGQIEPDRLRVLARSATQAYKGTSKSSAVIGQELGVDYLLEASLQTEADKLRVTSRLTRVRDQVQVWSQSFDREPTSLLGLQRELSIAIAEQIRLKLTPDQMGAMTRREARSAEAYDLYLRGRNFENQRTPATTQRAIEHYMRATAIDPEYARAWSGLSLVLGASLFNGDAAPAVVAGRARDAANRAMQTGPESAEAHQAVAFVKWCCDWDWAAAESRMRRGATLDPDNAMIHVQLGHILSQLGRHRESADVMRRARELDPLFAMSPAMSSQTAFQARDFAGALALADQTITLDPEFWIGHMMRGQALEQMGEYDQALESLTLAARFSGQNSKAMSLRGYILARTGRADEARRVARLLEELSASRYVPPFAIELIYAGLDDKTSAFSWLDRAYDARDVHLIYLPVDAKWDRYRDDPRFVALLARCGFSH